MTGVLKERTTLGFPAGGKLETEGAAAAPPEGGSLGAHRPGDTCLPGAGPGSRLTEDQTAQGKANAVGLGRTDSPECGALGLRARLTRFQEPLHRV